MFRLFKKPPKVFASKLVPPNKRWMVGANADDDELDDIILYLGVGDKPDGSASTR